MAKAVYQSCMNKELIERRGLEPVKAMLKRLGGWPLLEGAGWDGAGFRWYEQMYRHRELGFSVDYFYDFSVSTDLKVRDLSTIFGEGPFQGLLLVESTLNLKLSSELVVAHDGPGPAGAGHVEGVPDEGARGRRRAGRMTDCMMALLAVLTPTLCRLTSPT